MQIQKTLASSKLYIGIDVHKKSWYVHFKTDICDHRGFSMPPNFDDLYKYVQVNFPKHEVEIVYEAGCCGFSLARQAMNAAWQVVVCNPADIPRSDKSNYQKTDKIDARNLCKLLQQGLLKEVHVPTEQKEQLCLLLRQRNNITKMLRTLKCQIKANLLYQGIEIPTHLDTPTWSVAFKTWLQQLTFEHSTGLFNMQSKLRVLNTLHQEYLDIATHLRAYCKQHYKEQYVLLKSVPGIGGYLASAILAELGDITRFKNEKQFSSYIGLVPGIYESAGKDSFKGITPRCRSLIRSYLVEAAWVALRLDPELQAYYRKHVGKNPKTVIIKIAHKVAKRILAVVKTQQPYKKNYTMPIDDDLIKQLPPLEQHNMDEAM
jgi:transposase